MFYGTTEDEFFDKNPEHKYVPQVAALIEAYGKEKAGRYMWAIWLVHHPGSSLFEMAPEDKIEWVKATYLNDPDFEWPDKKITIVKPEKKKPKKKKGLDDEYDDEEIEDDDFEIDINDRKFRGVKDKDLLFEETGTHQAFYDVIEIFPLIAMSFEERDYYGLVRLRDLARMRAEYLNGKDMAAAVKQLASSSPDLDRMKAKYLTWQESGSARSSGEIQSGWGASLKKG